MELNQWILAYDAPGSEAVLEILKQMYHQTLVRTRLEAHLDLALEHQANLMAQLDHLLKQQIYPSLEQEYTKLKVLVELEQRRVSHDQHPPLVKPSTGALIEQPFRQAKALGDKELIGAVYLVKVEVSYIHGDYAAALKNLDLADSLITEVGHRLWSGRFRSLVLSLIGNRREFLELEPLLIDLILQGRELNLDSADSAQEGLGRAQGHLGYERGMETLTPGYLSFVVPPSKCLRQTQLIRSRLDTRVALGLTPSADAEQEFATGLRYCQDYGYGRYLPLLRASGDQL